MDFEGNTNRIIASIREAKARGASYRIGPELEITGYGCEDHFLEHDTCQHAWECLAAIIASGATAGILCDIGLPVEHRGVRYNCRALVHSRRILLLRPKMDLANDGNYRETRWFATWKRLGVVESVRLPAVVTAACEGQREVPIGDGVLDLLDSTLASETCEELFTPLAPHIRAALAGAEVVGNGSGSHHELRKLGTRVGLVQSATSKAGGVYLYANQKGCDGGRLYYDGCAMVVVNGQVVAQGSQFTLADVEVVTATVDLDQVASYRGAISSLREQASASAAAPSTSFPSLSSAASPAPPIVRIPSDISICHPSSASLTLAISHPLQIRYHLPEEEIALGPACWLWDYLRRSGASGFLLPLSGGADSSSVAAIVGCMCQLVAKGAVGPLASRCRWGGADCSSAAAIVGGVHVPAGRQRVNQVEFGLDFKGIEQGRAAQWLQSDSHSRLSLLSPLRCLLTAIAEGNEQVQKDAERITGLYLAAGAGEEEQKRHAAMATRSRTKQQASEIGPWHVDTSIDSVVAAVVVSCLSSLLPLSCFSPLSLLPLISLSPPPHALNSQATRSRAKQLASEIGAWHVDTSIDSLAAPVATRARAKQLASEIGAWHLDTSIDSVVAALVALFLTVTGLRPRYKVVSSFGHPPRASLPHSHQPASPLQCLLRRLKRHLHYNVGRPGREGTTRAVLWDTSPLLPPASRLPAPSRSWISAENQAEQNSGAPAHAARLPLFVSRLPSRLAHLSPPPNNPPPPHQLDGGTSAENLALQNIQARLRMVLAFLFAQLLPWVRGHGGRGGGAAGQTGEKGKEEGRKESTADGQQRGGEGGGGGGGEEKVPVEGVLERSKGRGGGSEQWGGGGGFLLVLGSANVDEALRGYLTKCQRGRIALRDYLTKVFSPREHCVSHLSLLCQVYLKTTIHPFLPSVPVAHSPRCSLSPLLTLLSSVPHLKQDNRFDLRQFLYNVPWPHRPLHLFLSPWPTTPPSHASPTHPLPPGRAISQKTTCVDVWQFLCNERWHHPHLPLRLPNPLPFTLPIPRVQNYSPEDNRFDLRQFLYNVAWPWQFKRIDQLVAEHEAAAATGAAGAAAATTPPVEGVDAAAA
ncbi:unnamed protein product [Closterium sp. Naga37s-1]|nr:unnamed protein product [Closterium sp. Naga37s-1]